MEAFIGVALAACFVSLSAPRPPAPALHPNMAVNVNFVWGPGRSSPADLDGSGAFIFVLCAVFVLGIFAPTHLILRQIFARGTRGAR